MNIRKALEILEIGPDATADEVKQAYKDLVAVWHPDRFSHNPRLRSKAEEKLKEANLAYETLKSFFSGRQIKADEGRADPKKRDNPYRQKPVRTSKTELAAELGTGAVLTLWSFVSKKINDILSDDPRRNKG